jgi:hypothetical protein
LDDIKKRYILEFVEIEEKENPFKNEKIQSPENLIKKSLNINVNAFFPSSVKQKSNESNKSNKTSPKIILEEQSLKSTNTQQNIYFYYNNTQLPFSPYFPQNFNSEFNKSINEKLVNKDNTKSSNTNQTKSRSRINSNSDASIYEINPSPYINNK